LQRCAETQGPKCCLKFTCENSFVGLKPCGLFCRLGGDIYMVCAFELHVLSSQPICSCFIELTKRYVTCSTAVLCGQSASRLSVHFSGAMSIISHTSPRVICSFIEIFPPPISVSNSLVMTVEV